MAETYLINPYNKPKVIHKNKNKDDNRLFNLKWCLSDEFRKNRKKDNFPTGFQNISYCKDKKQFHLEIKNKNLVIHKQIFPINKWVLDEIIKIRNNIYLEFNIMKCEEISTGYNHISIGYDEEGSFYKFQIRSNNIDLAYQLFRTSEVLLDEVVEIRNKSYKFWEID
jgi:hypothetical protein